MQTLEQGGKFVQGIKYGCQLEGITTGPVRGKFVQGIKYGCQLEGIITGPVRKPLQDMNNELKREFEVTVRTVKSTIAQICNHSTVA